MISRFQDVFHITNWLSNYQPAWFIRDVIAGVTVAAFTVPEAMAFASLAGLPPQHGLYASFLAPLAYVLFGSSRFISIGPTSAVSVTVGAGLGALALSPERYIEIAALTAIMSAVFFLIAWFLHLDFLANFISESVLTGFTTGAAFFIAATQLGAFTGVHNGSSQFFDSIAHLVQNLDEISLLSLAIGTTALVILLTGAHFYPGFPFPLVVVLVATGASWWVGLGDHGVEIVGEIPRGLPGFSIPAFNLGQIRDLLPVALGVFLLTYLQAVGVVKSLAKKHNEHSDARRELLGLGAANILVGLGQGFPVGGSMSRSAVNEQSRAKSPLAGGIAALLIGLVVLFLTGFFQYLPEPVLAAVVLFAVAHLADFPALRRIFRISRREFAVALAALLGVVIFGMLEGILIAVILSLILLIQRVSNPHIAILGRIPDSRQFGDIERNPENETIPGILILRVDSFIFFGNAEQVRERVLGEVERHERTVELVVLDLAVTPFLDMTGASMLRDLHDELAQKGIQLRLAKAIGPLRDMLRAEGMEDELSARRAGRTVERVIEDWQSSQE
jgi:sulfate permease, SulP family